MTDVTLSITDFRTAYPAYADETDYPDALIQSKFDLAECYITAEDYGCLSGNCRVQAIYMMTAHLLYIDDQIAAGGGTGDTGMITSASIKNVSVTRLSPQTRDAWEYWLYSSPYGQQLMALLDVVAVGPWYIGGLPEKAAVARVGGIFAPYGR